MKEFAELETALYRNNLELARRKFGRNNDVPDRDAIIARRDYTAYRLGGASHQLGLLSQTINAFKNKYDSQRPQQIERIETIYHAKNHVSYCFDNLIFNLASLSDYFANYLGLYVFGPRFQSIKWSGFTNKCADIYSEHPFGLIVASQHRQWFTRIHEFRGELIHQKSMTASVKGYVDTRYFPQEVSNLEFELNNSVKRYFHIFRGIESNDLLESAKTISARSLVGFSDILIESEKIEFDEKHKYWNMHSSQ